MSVSVDARSVEEKVRALLAAHGLSQHLFSGSRLLEQQQGAASAAPLKIGRMRIQTTQRRPPR